MTRHNEFMDTFTPTTFVGNHDVDRIASLVGDAGLVIAMTILCTVGGTPAVYYGDEQAFRGTKGEGWTSDDTLRPEFPPTPAQLPDAGWPVFRFHQQLLGLRRERPWLTTARTEQLTLKNPALTYRTCSADGAHALTVEIDIETTPRAVVREDDKTLFDFRG